MSCSTAWAQGTAQINGTIRDASGAIVPGAEIRMDPDSHQRSPHGDQAATLTALTFWPGSSCIGPYQLEVFSKEGFSRDTFKSGLVLEVNE